MKIFLEPGETKESIGKLFNIPVDLLETVSDPQIPCEELPSKKTNRIAIPGLCTLPYHVQKGDNLRKLEQDWNVPLTVITRINNLKPDEDLREGQLIWHPLRITSPIIPCKMPYHSKVLEQDIEILKKAYPFVKVRIIGRSVLRKPIYELIIGSGKRKIHFNASFHANEWITSAILMDLANHYLLGLTNGLSGWDFAHAYMDNELSIVPMVNPDGVDLVLQGPPLGCELDIVQINDGRTDFTGWKANIRGVDLNNQFPANWAIEKERKEPKSPSSRDFPGEAPLTEPEAIVMAELARSREFDMVFAFHSQGEEFYWGYNNREPEEAGKLAGMMGAMSGYRPVRTIDSHAGFKDWFIEEFQKPGFTIEVGKGINPLPLSHYDSIFQSVSSLFFSVVGLKKN
ncbi:hypothetical protein A8F94_04395 [Bacillus sp. FJAT-27225]|uniref:M14 family metallopeptidase n=1 Tax=Bacillus sp. FJAT-27225 TaxID=1743144 RepID=UPI00080C3121|nr:M14 family metallopeptidase [Bacillus sp. FJAT-27225]OCA91106.1 hypothetical protein A8F94_04395 [Bacillus sp. FJAT-27225]